MNKISVVIPSYNRPDYLREAVRSVQAQEVAPFEIIISDNHSKIALGDVAADFPNLPIRQIKPPQSLPVDAHWLWALNQAEGEYIALLEDDNLWRSYHLKKLIVALEASPHCGLACSGAVEFHELLYQVQSPLNAPMIKTNLLTEETVYLGVEAALGSILYNTDATSSTFILRRSMFKLLAPQARGFEAAHDRWLWAQMVAQGGLIYCPSFTVLYRQHASQLVHAINGAHYRKQQTSVVRLILELMQSKRLSLPVVTEHFFPWLTEASRVELAQWIFRDRDLELIRLLIPPILGKKSWLACAPHFLTFAFQLAMKFGRKRLRRALAFLKK